MINNLGTVFLTITAASFSEPTFLVNFILSILLVIAGTYLTYAVCHRLFISLLVFVLSGAIYVCQIFELYSATILFAVVLVTVSILFAYSNFGLIRGFFISNKSNFAKKIIKSKKPTKIVNTSDLYSTIADTVKTLSASKTGAIITFPKKDDLTSLSKNGVNLGGCPVTKELLLTIFYPGTRLHDGAVIIKDGKIISASVYFELTTRPLSGKFGSRHRAALGISERTDSITVVVSEETGRISIAQDGELTNVTSNEFLNVFTQLMDEE